MSPRDWKDRIRDILDAIAEIQKFTRGMDYEMFRGDEKAIRAVEMNLIIEDESITGSNFSYAFILIGIAAQVLLDS